MAKTCISCKHYIQHYGKKKRGRYYKLYCGHCFHPRIKSRKPDTTACEHYIDKETKADSSMG